MSARQARDGMGLNNAGVDCRSGALVNWKKVLVWPTDPAGHWFTTRFIVGTLSKQLCVLFADHKNTNEK